MNRLATKIDYKGKKVLPVAAAKMAGVKEDTFYHRVLRGWSIKKAIETPVVAKRMDGGKQRSPTPIRFSESEEQQIVAAAKKAGAKKSTWIKTAVMEKLSRKPSVKRIDERNDQETTI